LPALESWTVMVQREVADRFFARPSTKAYGAVSVLVQLVTERTGFHSVSASAFRPRPNVESALVAFRRIGLPREFRRVKRVVEGSFAHRRKLLANSLELAGVADRDAASSAIARLGKPPTVRAEELEPQDFVQFGGVQAAIEEEQRLRIEGVVSSAIGEILDESGVEANIIIQHGEAVKAVRDYVGERPEVAALVLGAAPSGNPGPLVSGFCGADAGKFSCPVMLIPGSLTDERLEQLS
jgi:hypothetical protein